MEKSSSTAVGESLLGLQMQSCAKNLGSSPPVFRAKLHHVCLLRRQSLSLPLKTPDVPSLNSL